MTAETFWASTPREVHEFLEGAAWRERQHLRRARYVAWWTAALQRVERFPSMEKVIGGPKTQAVTTRQTPAEQVLALQAWKAHTEAKAARKAAESHG
jgi:hypothetical protein